MSMARSGGGTNRFSTWTPSAIVTHGQLPVHDIQARAFDAGSTG